MRRAKRPHLLDSPAPWHPTASSWATLFLLPLAGGLVTAVNLMRLQHPDKAAFAMLSGIVSLFFLLAIWSFGRATGDYLLFSYLVLTLGDIGLFLYLQYDDFSSWQKAHPQQQPANSWAAAIWSLLGFGLMLIIATVWVIVFLLFTASSSNMIAALLTHHA